MTKDELHALILDMVGAEIATRNLKDARVHRLAAAALRALPDAAKARLIDRVVLRDDQPPAAGAYAEAYLSTVRINSAALNELSDDGIGDVIRHELAHIDAEHYAQSVKADDWAPRDARRIEREAWETALQWGTYARTPWKTPWLMAA